ncbi:MAG: ABC transporter transmembrane domain-containing protein [Bacteriovoracia bacterium]
MRKRLELKLKTVLFRHFLEYWWIYLLAIICLVVTHYSQSQLPFMAKELGDLLVSDSYNKINLWDFIFIALAIIIFRTASRLLFFYPARMQQKDLRIEFLQELENTPPVRYRDYPKGQIYQIMVNDFGMLRALVGFAFLQVGNAIIASVILIPKLFTFNSSLLWGLIPMLASLIIFSISIGFFQKYFKQASEYQGDTQNYLIECFRGKKTIKNFQAEIPFVQHFKKYSDRELQVFYQASKGRAVMGPTIKLGLGLSLLWGAYIVQSNNMEASALILFSGFAFLLLEPLLFMSWIGVISVRAMASWKRIVELLTILRGEAFEELQLKEYNPKFNIDEHDNIDLRINLWGNLQEFIFKKQRWTIMVGATGSGKSKTLQDLADILKIHEKRISLVAQVPFLYNDSVCKNLFLGKTPDQKERDLAWKLLKLFELDVLAPSADALLNMEVGENGKQLSGGQIKRIALIRSILSEAEFLLWDDPFAAVDVFLEQTIISALKKEGLLDNRTLLLTGHRLTTARFCDYAMLLEKEKGVSVISSKEELLNQEGQISEFFAKQLV